jgi:ADP-ribosylglycohydrolase
MTLFTAAGLLSAATRNRLDGKTEPFAEYIRRSYLDWKRTQVEGYPLKSGPRYSWLTGVQGLFDRRAPGNTCMSAMGDGGRGTVERPVNRSKGCGGVMRVAPVGLYFDDRDTDVREIACIGAQAAAITHGHDLGWMPAAVLAQIVHEVSQDGTGVREATMHALDTAAEMWPESKDLGYFLELTNRALELAGQDTDDLEAIHALGEGWVAEETLAIAVYCALKYSDGFEKAIIAAVNHDGDSDSTGAVTGNILGAYLGVEAIPQYYLEDLELRDIIEEIAEDLYNDCKMEEDGEYYDPIWDSKYIKVDYDAAMRNKG